MTDLHWWSEGSGDPVLMIMGLGTSSAGWRRLLPYVRERHQAIVFDNRGTGKSPAVTGPSTMTALVDDALSVLDAAGQASAHVLGASMGGMIAQHLALEHRDRVRSLGLICTTPVGSSGRPPWRLLAGTALRPFVGAEQIAKLSAPMLYARGTREERPQLMAEDLEARMSDPTPARTSWAQMAAIRGHDTRRRLAELAGLPVTVIHGDEDVLVPTDRGRALAEQIPGARLVLVPGAGHLLTTDNETDSAAAVLAHLAWATELSGRRVA
jgi:pimeloyl-ACP methyl ester carboxylesterase